MEERSHVFSSFFCTDCTHCTVNYTVKTYVRGQYIAYQGDWVAHFYMLSKGRVKTQIVGESGVVMPMEEMTAPYPLAVAFLFADNNSFPVDVIALEDCQVLLIKKEEVEKQMARCPGFMHGYLAFVANHMQYLSHRLKVFAHKGITSRLVYYILSKSSREEMAQGVFTLGRSVASLAAYMGVERPSLSRALGDLEREGVLTFDSATGKGRILDFIRFRVLLG